MEFLLITLENGNQISLRSTIDGIVSLNEKIGSWITSFAKLYLNIFYLIGVFSDDSPKSTLWYSNEEIVLKKVRARLRCHLSLDYENIPEFETQAIFQNLSEAFKVILESKQRMADNLNELMNDGNAIFKVKGLVSGDITTGFQGLLDKVSKICPQLETLEYSNPASIFIIRSLVLQASHDSVVDATIQPMAKVMGNTLIKEISDERLKSNSFKAICIAFDVMLNSNLDPNVAMSNVKLSVEKSVEIVRDESVGFAIILFAWKILMTSSGGQTSNAFQEALKDIQDTFHAKLGKFSKEFRPTVFEETYRLIEVQFKPYGHQQESGAATQQVGQNPMGLIIMKSKLNPDENLAWIVETSLLLYFTFGQPIITPWLMSFDDNCFESVHGASRVLKLIPDKLATSMAINREEIEGEFGAFLVENTLQLFKFFIDKNRNRNKSQFWIKVQQQIVAEFGGAPDFPDILEVVKSMLESFIENLKNRDMREYDRAALKVSKYCDLVLQVCIIYLELFQPLSSKVRRAGNLDVAELARLKDKTEQELEENQNILEDDLQQSLSSLSISKQEE